MKYYKTEHANGHIGTPSYLLKDKGVFTLVTLTHFIDRLRIEQSLWKAAFFKCPSQGFCARLSLMSSVVYLMSL